MDTTTALAFVITDESATKEINIIREKYDRAYNRWPPHINFIFPFVSANNFDDILEKLEQLNIEPFDITIDSINYFPQGKNCTIHLKCDKESEQKMINVFNQITKALPDIKVKNPDFHPHLTIAQCKKSEVNDKISEIHKTISVKFKFHFNALHFLQRTPETNDKMTIINTLKLTKNLSIQY